MVVHLVELWTPTERWGALSSDERSAFFGGVVARMEKAEGQANCAGWGLVDQATDNTGSHTYLAVWDFPSSTEKDEFLATLRDAGWYDYFDQANYSAVLGPPEQTAGHMIGGQSGA